MTRAFVSLGSNLGNRGKNIASAVEALGEIQGVRVRRVSRVRETEPVGRTDQPNFLNAVAELECEGGPEELLERLLQVEARLGRVRSEPWGPRIIDLDLLLFGAERRNSARLTLPHPRIAERRFVIEPLAELEPDLVLPGDDRSVGRRLREFSQES
jgi:2-amino-4-hydroxy-6-hydroxymethyldihydropteridine diphosphokinase